MANPNSMRPASPVARRREESGFTLLMVVFLVAVMSITAMAVAPNLLTEGRRDKEAEMIWRGEQYQRAIRLYVTKFGKYPTKIEDLTKQTNGVRFLRQAYPDPMNKEDGSWRFIYMGLNGQLIGSLRPVNLLQSALTSQGIPGLSGSLGAQPPPPGGNATGLQQTTGPGIGTGIGTGSGIATPGQQSGSATTANPLESQPQPLMGDVLGGNIAGVGSKIKKPSLKVYFGGDTYQQWEFVYNINGQQTVVPGQTVNPNANPTVTPGGAGQTGTGQTGSGQTGGDSTGSGVQQPQPQQQGLSGQ